MANKSKKVILISSLLILFLIFIKPTCAVGIYFSNDNKINFKPGIEKAFSFEVTKCNLRVRLSVSGYLSEYAILSKTSIESDSTDRKFTVTVKLPEKIEKPGHHKIFVMAEGIIDETSGGAFGTSSNAKVYILINVLNPGKYVDMRLSAPNVNLNEPVNFAVNVKNFGEENISRIKAAIDVYSQNNEKLATVYTDEKALISNTEETLHAQLNTAGYSEGIYKATAILNYDGETNQANDTFKIGKLNIKIINYTKEFEKDKINLFNIKIDSDWGNKIENLYGEIKINNMIIKTPNINLNPWEKKTITAYWDTNNLEIGPYNTVITVYYEDKTTVETGIVNVIEKRNEDITKKNALEKPGAITISLSTTTILIIIIILLIMVDIIWIVKKQKSATKQKIVKK